MWRLKTQTREMKAWMGDGEQRRGSVWGSVGSHSPLQPRKEDGCACGGGTRTKPRSGLGPAAPSQLTGPELIIINEQLGPVSWDLHG